jgi:hypothetical protein
MVLIRSGVHPITEQDPNLRTFPHGGEDDDVKIQDVETTLKSSADIRNDTVYLRDKLPSFHPNDLIGASYLQTETDEEGLILRATIVNKIKENDALGREKALKFLVQYGDKNGYTEIVAYNDICDILEKQREADESGVLSDQHAFRSIIGHEGPLKPGDPKYKNSSHNLLVHWEDGSTSWEPLIILAKDDRVSVAKYGLGNDVLDKPGWKRLKAITRRKVHFQRMVNQSKVAPSCDVPLYKFGVCVPRNIKEANMLDGLEGNTKWNGACLTEIEKLHLYKCLDHKDMVAGFLQVSNALNCCGYLM